MKMNLGFFLGALLILVGVLLIIKIFVPVHIPVFKIALGLFVIYLGVRILTSGSSFSHMRNDNSRQQVLFDEVRLGDKELARKISVVFGKATYDLSNLELGTQSRRLEIDVAFGDAQLLLPPNLPVIINGNVAFGQISLPRGNAASFGSSQYVSPSFSGAQPYLDIKIDIAFGKAAVNLIQ